MSAEKRWAELQSEWRRVTKLSFPEVSVFPRNRSTETSSTPLQKDDPDGSGQSSAETTGGDGPLSVPKNTIDLSRTEGIPSNRDAYLAKSVSDRYVETKRVNESAVVNSRFFIDMQTASGEPQQLTARMEDSTLPTARVDNSTEISTPKINQSPAHTARLDLPAPVDSSMKTQRREGSEGLLARSRAKQELRKGTISQHVSGQLKGLQRAIQVRQHREQILTPHINTHVIGGTFLMRFDEGVGKQSLVGIGKGEAGTLWWELRDAVTVTQLADIVSIEYGMGSECFKSLQASSNGNYRNVLPWDCFTVVYKNGQVANFFADRRRTALVQTNPKSGKRSLVTNYSTDAVQIEEILPASHGRVLEMDKDVELFILGMSLLFRKHLNQGMRPGMTVSLTQLRFRRALIKNAYLKQLGVAGEDLKLEIPAIVSETGPISEQKAQEVKPAEEARTSSIVVLPPEERLEAAISSTEAHREAQIQRLGSTVGESNFLKQARSNLRPWGILPTEMPAIVRRRFEAIQQTVQVRKAREAHLYAIIEKQVLGGTYFQKLEDDLRALPCMVGIGGDESVTFWWDHIGSVTAIPLTQVVRVRWGTDSPCYKLLQKAKTGDLLNVLPWNCFSVEFSGDRIANFFADRRGRSFVKLDKKTGKRMLVTNRATDTFKRDPVIIESAARVSEINDDVEKFLFGFACLFRQERSERSGLRAIRFLPGLPVSLTQLKMQRALLKMRYINECTADDLETVLCGQA
jgi:hypothetical protein